MDIILTQGGSSLVLPVLPESYEVGCEWGNQTVNVNAIGEVNLLGLGKLETISWSCFFPAREETYTRRGIMAPKECVSLLKAMEAAGPLDIHLLDVLAMHATIESFQFSEKDGTGDIYYSINLKRYIYINREGVVNRAILGGAGRPEPETPRDGVRYTVKEGDTLFAIARRQLGTTDWTPIYTANRDVIGANPSLLTPGTVLRLPA